MKTNLSLTARIALEIFVTGLVTLMGVGWFLSSSMQDNLLEEHDDMLGDHLALLRREIAKDGPALHETEEIIVENLGALHEEKTFGRLVDSNGTVLLETKGFSDYSPSLDSYPKPMAANASVPSFVVAYSPSGGPVFVTAAHIARPNPLPELTYYVVNDASQEQRMTQRFRIQVIAAIFIGSLASAVLGWLVTRRGLRPLQKITAEVEATTAEALQNQDGETKRAHTWPAELERLAAAFAALRGRLGQSFRQLRQFSDDAAHELRSPLNNMMGLASLTLQRDRSAEEYRAALASTLEECERLRKLADGLLFISRADHRRSVLTCQAFNANQAVAEIVDYHSEVAQDQGVSLVVEGSGLLNADRSLFRQAVANLLSNALRHTSAGGQITVHFSPASESNKLAVLTVSDTGEGIASEHLPHVFDRFYRVDAARSHTADAPPQTGLGLAIVKAIVELHGGSIAAESTVGKGTRFTLLWPQD